ncbi:hypothetical protein ACN27F_05535 [Solwaraspora sp. WMMB335]|uniref:hypothetical protein n=1 Tax=Solwaraspora sp. WMMB335 TaxID=3404118 RepID=UPI003B961E70
MSSYTITIAPDDQTRATTTLRVEMTSSGARITELLVRAGTGAGLTPGQLPAVNVEQLLRSIVGQPADPAIEADPRPTAPAADAAKSSPARALGDQPARSDDQHPGDHGPTPPDAAPDSVDTAADGMLSSAPTQPETDPAVEPAVGGAADPAAEPAPTAARRRRSAGRDGTRRGPVAPDQPGTSTKASASTQATAPASAGNAPAVTARKGNTSRSTGRATGKTATAGKTATGKTATAAGKAASDGGRSASGRSASGRSAAASTRKPAVAGTRAYRRAPDDLGTVYAEAGDSVAAVAAHYAVPRHTAQSWVRTMRRKQAPGRSD